jgi:hypothetical protein
MTPASRRATGQSPAAAATGHDAENVSHQTAQRCRTEYKKLVADLTRAAKLAQHPARHPREAALL